MISRMQKSWQTMALGECCDIVSGSTPRRDNPEYWGGDIAWVTPKDLSHLDGPVFDEAVEYISVAGFKSCSTQMLPKGAILFSSRAPIGLVAIAGRSLCTNQGFKSLVPHDCVDSRYLYYCMKRLVPRVQSLGNGATFKEVSRVIMEKVEIPLPPLSEQKRIADILDKADAIRRKRKDCRANLANLPASLFENMFGDPVTNPKKWHTHPLEKVLSLQGGYAFKSSDYVASGIPLIRIGNANNQQFNAASLVFLPEQFTTEYERFLLTPGDMIMTLTGTVGKDDYANLIRVPKSYYRWFLNQRVARVRLRSPDVLEEYLVHFLMHPRVKRQIRKMNRGVRQANLSNADILSQILPIPPLPEQELFSKRAASSLALQESTERAALLDDNLFDSLVQTAFKGAL